MKFFQRNKPTAPKEDLKQVTAAPKQAPASPSRNKPNPSIEVLSKKDDIPVHSAVLSVTGGPIELPPEWQKNYAILLTSRDKKEVEVICSIEVIRKAGLDDDYMAIVDRIKRSGYTRTKAKKLAKPEIIQIIYEQTEQKRSLEDQQKAATKIQLEFDELLVSALKEKASDIHIEVTRKGAEVRFRVNGALQTFEEWPVRHARTMAGVIYMVIAEEKDTSFDERREQSAIIDRDLGEWGSVRVRLNTLPNYPAGFDMIMRILKMGQSGDKIDLNKLGYQKDQLSKVRRAVAKPVGAIIMAGTTGSGKSTSLNAMLSEKIQHHEGRIKVITVEDPPEYLLPGSTQVPVVRSRAAAKDGADVNPFASTVRAAMRSDPDVLMIGEVRDIHSAELLIHAVQSGHQVFSTTHASSGIDIISRLRSNGIPDDVLGSHNFIAGLMYQTLLQTVCQHCSTDFAHFKNNVHDEAGEELVHRVYRHLGSSHAKNLRFISPQGCEHCRKGVTGRTVAAEVILPDAYMLRAFRSRQDDDAMMHYAYNGGKFALHHGIEKMLTGLCDIRDVEHKLDQIAALQEMESSVRFFVASSDYSHYINAQREAAEAAKVTSNESSLIIVPEQSLVVPEKEIVLPGDPVQPVVEAPRPTPAIMDKPVEAPEVQHEASIRLLKESKEDEGETGAQGSASATTTDTETPDSAPVVPEMISPVEIVAQPIAEAPASEEFTKGVSELESKPVVSPIGQPSAEATSSLEQEPPVDQPANVKAAEELPAADGIELLMEDRAEIEVIQDHNEVAEQSPAVIAESATLVVVTPKATGLLACLLEVLCSEVKRTGIPLSGRFFKARLSKTAIAALIASENTPKSLAESLKNSVEALSEDELALVLGTEVEALQIMADAAMSEKVVDNQPVTVAKDVEVGDEPTTEQVAKVEAITVAEPKAKATRTPKNVTDLAQKRTAANKDKTPAKPRAPRKFKSKLLSSGAEAEPEAAKEKPVVKEKGGDNVKSLADARSRKAPAKKKVPSNNQDDKK